MLMELLMISIIVCFIIDISGFIENVKYMIWKWVFNGKKEYQEFRLKPFDCSLCMSWWIGLIWILCNGQFTLLNILLVSLFAALSENISNMIIIIKQLIHKVQDLILLLITNKR